MVRIFFVNGFAFGQVNVVVSVSSLLLLLLFYIICCILAKSVEGRVKEVFDWCVCMCVHVCVVLHITDQTPP